MPGLVGIWSNDPNVIARPALETMIRPMLYHEKYRAVRVGAQGFALGAVTFDETQLIAQRGSVTLGLYGDITGLEELKRKLSPDSTPTLGDSPAAILLAAHMELGVDALCGLNGLYTVAIHDDHTKRLTLINDRYGFQRMYYWSGPKSFVFSSEIKGIITHPEYQKKVDEAALIHFLNSSFPLDDRTLFAGIRLLGHASKLTVMNGQIACDQYWDCPFGSPDAGYDNEDVRAGLAARIRSAVERRMSNNSCLLLTGGLDSRTLASAIPRNRADDKIMTASLGHAHCHDVRFGRRIASKVGLPNVLVPIDSNYLETCAERGMLRTEGQVSCHGYWNVLPDAMVNDHGIEHFMSGCFSGGIRSLGPLVDSMPDQFKGWKRDEGAMRWYYELCMAGGFIDDDLDQILLGKPDGARDLAYQAVLKTFHAAKSDRTADKLDYVVIVDEDRRFIMENINMMGALARVTAPLRDNDLVDYSNETRPSQPVGRSAHIRIINEHFSDVSGVPRTAENVPLNASWLSSKVRRGSMRFYHHVLPAATFGKWGGHEYGAYAHYDEYIRSGSRQFVEETLATTELIDDLVNMDAVRSLVASHMDGRSNEYSKVCILLTLALWRKHMWSL